MKNTLTGNLIEEHLADHGTERISAGRTHNDYSVSVKIDSEESYN
jgi:hypothetical protein